MAPRSLLVLAMLAAACGDVRCAPSCTTDIDVGAPTRAGQGGAHEGSADATCPGPARSGTTSCFPGECPVGQYCDDTAMPTCRPGCASDASCGPRDVCVREGEAAIGRCESCLGREAHEPAPGCVVASRTGTTSCFPGECPVGQRCVDEAMPHCEPGCASDENCGPAEHCVRKDGAVIGVCRSCFYD